MAAAQTPGVEQRHLEIVGNRHADEGPRKLEAARHAEPGALVRGQPGEIAAFELDRAGLVDERAAQTVDERALARAVWTDQSNTLARGDAQLDPIERNQAAETFAQVLHLQQRAHAALRCSPRRG